MEYNYNQPQPTLPPLPGSDPESIAQNKFHGFYNVGSRKFWKDADVSLYKLQDQQPCQHAFAKTGAQVQCRRCHVGFSGPGISANSDGKLLINNQVAVL